MCRSILVIAFALLGTQAGFPAELKPETAKAFDRYIQQSEQRMSNELRAGPFLSLDALPPPEQAEAYAELKQGRVLSQRLHTEDQGQPIPVPGGLIHHWVGAVFIPGATLEQTLTFLQDYDHQARFYAPDVQRSRLLERNGNHFKVSLRLKKTKVVTVFLDTEYDVDYVPIDGVRAASNSRSTRIVEIENAGRSDEKAKPAGEDGGYLWRLNSYWRFWQKDGGVYVQLEAISLTRDIPAALAWLIRPFVTSIPRESLDFTLQRTRDALRKNP